MTPEKIDYMEALAKDLDARGEVASAGMVRTMVEERAQLVEALERILATIDDEADRAFAWPAQFREHSLAYRIARKAIDNAQL